MEPRTIAIGLIAVIAAFAAAFGIASSGGGKTATAGPGTKATTIKVAAPAAVAGVEVGGTLPALKSQPKKPAKKKAKKAPAATNSAPSTTNTTPSAPSTSNTTPSTPSTPKPSAPAPRPSAPKPKPSTPAPVSGGGTDG